MGENNIGEKQNKTTKRLNAIVDSIFLCMFALQEK